MGISYAATSNLITVTGVQVPDYDFEDLHIADLAGTFMLHARTGIGQVDTSAVSVDNALRPAEQVVLGGSGNDLYLTIANWTGLTSATIRITGTDASGNSQTEDLVITGNGTIYAAKWFRTITTTQVVSFTGTPGTDSFDYTLEQGRWGVIYKYTSTLYRVSCQINIGDGTTTTRFADSLKQIHVDDSFSVDDTTWFFLSKYSETEFGALDDLGNRATRDGCQFFLDRASSAERFFHCTSSTPILNLYQCSIASNALKYARANRSGANWINNLFDNVTLNEPLGKVNNLISNGGNYGVYIPVSTDLDNVTLIARYPYFMFLAVDRDCVLKNSTLITTYRHFYFQGQGSNTPAVVIDAIDCVFYPGNIIVTWADGSQNFQIFLKNTVRLTVIDGNGDPIAGATVRLEDVNGGVSNEQGFETTTDANGHAKTGGEWPIVKYQQYTIDGTPYTTSSIITNYSPHTLIINANGFQTYRGELSLGEKTSMTIRLNRIVPLIVHGMGSAVNTDPTNPENMIYT